MTTAAAGRLMTEIEAMAYLHDRGVPASRTHLYRERQAGRLVAHQFGRLLRFCRADLDAWVASHRREGAPSVSP